MGGARDGAGGHEGKRKNGDPINQKPFNKLRYKIAKLGLENGEKSAPFTAAHDQRPTSPSTPLGWYSSISYSTDLGNSETLQESEKLIFPFPPLAAEEVRRSAPRTASPPLAPLRLASAGSDSVYNDNNDNALFSSPGSSNIGQTSAKRSPTRIEFNGPYPFDLNKPAPEFFPAPAPKPRTRLLDPFRTCTYLRPKPVSNTPRVGPMGPPAPVHCLTPYQTVKKVLTLLKNVLLPTSFPDIVVFAAASSAVGSETETPDSNPPPPYSLSNIKPELPWTMEKVLLELDAYFSSLPEDSSSREMANRLTDFQVRLGMDPWPCFYHMLWFSAAAFVFYLGHFFSYEDDDF